VKSSSHLTPNLDAPGKRPTYHERGRLSSLTQGPRQTTIGYDYDEAGRLKTVRRNSDVIAAYLYDANGNRLQANTEHGFFAGAYNQRDQLLSYGAASYTYTPTGDLLTKTDNGQTTAYSFDSLGTLTGVDLPGGTQVEFLLDAENRRIGKKLNGTLMQRWLYGDSLRVVAELDGSNAVASRFVYGTALTVPDYIVKGGATYRVIADHLGSPRIVIDAATGTVAQRLDYDVWGNLTQDTNPEFQPFAFTGREWDPETGFLYLRARWYDPGVVRFISEDPIGFGGGVGFYTCVLDDPVNLRDSLP